MVSTYKTKDDFLGAVSSHLGAQESQPNIRSALLTGIASAEDDLRKEDDKSQAFHLKLGSWVIRDNDIPLFEAVNSAATALVLTLTTAGIAWPAIATALTALANVCWRIWRKGAHLSSRQIAVYGLLREQGPITVNSLVDSLHKTDADSMQEDVASTLESLTEIELNDGQIITLAAKDSNERWKALKI